MYLPLQSFLLTAFGAASLFLIFVRYSLLHWKKRGILHDKPTFFWGHLQGVGKKRHISSVLQKTYENNKGKAPFVGFYAYLRPMLVILDLNLVRHILTTDAEYFMERGLYYNVPDDPLSGNLLQLDGKYWLKMNENCCPAFQADRLVDLLPPLLKLTKQYRHTLSAKFHYTPQENVSIMELVDEFNVDVCATLAYGLEPVDRPHIEFKEMCDSHFKNFHKLKAYLAWCFPTLARFLQYRCFDPIASAYFLNLVCDRLKTHSGKSEAEQQHAHDFLNHFAEIQYMCPQSCSTLGRRQMAAQIFTFVLIGREAANSTLACCLYELAMQPQIQTRAHNEINNVLKRHNGKIGVESLKEMTYVKQILYETLRMHSPYPFLLRRTVETYEIRNSVLTLQKGNRLIIPIHAIHQDPLLYPEPHIFDPERFTSEAMAQRPPLSFLPFGAGPRGCVANRFAKLPMLLCLTTLLQRYRFSACVETTPLTYDNSRLFLHTPKHLKLRVDKI